MRTRYDRSADSLCVEHRPLPAMRTREVEPDVMVDTGEDGEPVSYDIQHAATKRERIARLVLGEGNRAG